MLFCACAVRKRKAVGGGRRVRSTGKRPLVSTRYALHPGCTNTISRFLQALLGFKRNITHLDGHVVEIDRTGVTQPGEYSEQYVCTLLTHFPGYVQVFEGEGMPLFEQFGHGNLYVEYNVVLPVELSSDMRRSKPNSDSEKDL